MSASEWWWRLVGVQHIPTPTEEADGNGYGVIAGRGGSLEAAAQSKRYLVPLLLTGVQQSPGTQGRTDKNLCRCFGAPARRVFPDHLITYSLYLLTSPSSGKPRGSGWDSGRTKLPNPRAPPMPSDAD